MSNSSGDGAKGGSSGSNFIGDIGHSDPSKSVTGAIYFKPGLNLEFGGAAPVLIGAVALVAVAWLFRRRGRK